MTSRRELLDVDRLVVGVEAECVGLVEHLLQLEVGHRRHELDDRRQLAADPRDDGVVLRSRPEAGDQQRDARNMVVLFGDERCGRRTHAGDDDVQLVRERRDHVLGEPEDLRRASDRPEKEAELHHRTHRVQPEVESGDDAEVAAAAADGPEQVRVLVSRDVPDATVSGDHFRRHQVVHRQSVLPGQPPHPAAEGQAADPGVADDPCGDGEAVCLRGLLALGQGGTAADGAAPRSHVDGHVVHRAEVDLHAVLHHGVTTSAVRAAAHGDLELVATGETDRSAHV